MKSSSLRMSGASSLIPGRGFAARSAHCRCGQLSLGNSGLVMPISFRYAVARELGERRDLLLQPKLAHGGGGRSRILGCAGWWPGDV